MTRQIRTIYLHHQFVEQLRQRSGRSLTTLYCGQCSRNTLHHRCWITTGEGDEEREQVASVCDTCGRADIYINNQAQLALPKLFPEAAVKLPGLE